MICAMAVVDRDLSDLPLAILAEKSIQGASAVTIAAQPPLTGVTVRARLAFAAWTVLREAVPRTGAWPIVIGNEPALRPAPAGESTEGILVRAAALDPQRWATERVDADRARFAAPSAPWPDTVPHRAAFQVLSQLATQPTSAVLALVPTSVAYEVPAHLRFGGWNDCPPPEVHVSALRDWHQRFGAEPVVMTSDTVELLVRKPVATRGQALELARFQHAYCPDIVAPALQSVEALAATLLGDPRWYFWWA
jgi:hypothetical protein